MQKFLKQNFLFFKQCLIALKNSFAAQFYLPLRVKSEKIIDGQITDISRTPYQLRLSVLRLPICGATLVSSNIAFTAAHCVGLRAIPFLYSVQAGGNTMSDPRGQKIRVRRIVVNPNYPGRTGVSDDFSILFLWRDVIFRQVILRCFYKKQSFVLVKYLNNGCKKCILRWVPIETC